MRQKGYECYFLSYISSSHDERILSRYHPVYHSILEKVFTTMHITLPLMTRALFALGQGLKDILDGNRYT